MFIVEINSCLNRFLKTVDFMHGYYTIISMFCPVNLASFCHHKESFRIVFHDLNPFFDHIIQGLVALFLIKGIWHCPIILEFLRNKINFFRICCYFFCFGFGVRNGIAVFLHDLIEVLLVLFFTSPVLQ